MSVEQKAAQMVVANLGGIHFPNRYDEELVKNVGVGGVYGGNWANVSQSVKFISTLHAFAEQGELKIPPFVVGRYTCGMGPRLDDCTGVTPLPTQMAIAATGNPENAYTSASIAAKEMRSAGITVNLAPNLEISTEDDEFRFATSRFGSSPAWVSLLGTESIRGFQENGVLSAPGGFPGVPYPADTGRDVLPGIIKPIPTLSATDLKPYRDAIAAGADGIAVTDLTLPTVDSSGLPVMLSRDVLTGLIREMWGFQGLIIVDTITTKTISDNFTPHDAVVRAANAGADLIISVGGYWRHLTTIGHIVDAVRKDEISEETLDPAVLRILKYKQKYGVLEPAPPDLRNAKRTCAQPSSLAQSSDTLKRGMTLIKNDGSILPLDRSVYSSVFVAGVIGVEQMAKTLERYQKGVTYLESRAAAYDKWSVPKEDITRVEPMAQDADLIIVCTYSTDRLPRGQEALVRHLVSLDKPLLMVALGSPFDITFLEKVQACIAVYGPAATPRFLAANMDAVAEFILGDCPAELRYLDNLTASVKEPTRFDARELVFMPTGRLPLALSDFYRRGFAWTNSSARFVSGATWSFGDGDEAKGIAVVHKYEKAGLYTVEMNVMNTVGNVHPLSFPLSIAGEDGV
jgi:beta-N-acetylhexosaminidase